MWKTFLAGTTALAIAGGTFAYAQKGPAEFERVQRWRPTAEDITAFGDARIAALHAGLKLTRRAGEELAGSGKRAARSRQAALGTICRARQHRSSEGSDRAARPARRGDGQRGASLKKLADAAGPLYKSLDEGQKHRFVMLARLDGRQAAACAASCTGRRMAASRAARDGWRPTGSGASRAERVAGRRPTRSPRRGAAVQKAAGFARRLFLGFAVPRAARAGQWHPPLLSHARSA